MKLTFVVVNTFTEFDLQFDTPTSMSVPNRIKFKGNDYEVKLHATTDDGALFYLHPVEKTNFKIKVDLSRDLKDYLKDATNKEQPTSTNIPDWLKIGCDIWVPGNIKNIEFQHSKGGEYSESRLNGIIDTNKEILQVRLTAAIQSENYELAAELRDKISNL